MFSTDKAGRLILHFSNRNTSNLFVLEQRTVLQFSGKAVFSDTANSSQRGEGGRDLGQAAQLNPPGDGGVTGLGFSV